MKILDGADWEDARRWVQGLEDTLQTDGMKAELLLIGLKIWRSAVRPSSK